MTTDDAVEKVGFGLAAADKAQMENLRVLGRLWDLKPGFELDFRYGKPEPTKAGWLKIIRRNPQFAGIVSRPLGQEEKAAWGYHESDIVVEATVTTRSWGPITARAKVSASEREVKSGKEAYLPIQNDPGGMAEKRAYAAVARLAFGPEVPTEEDFERAGREGQPGKVEVRDRPAVTAADYDRVIGRWYEDDPLATRPKQLPEPEPKPAETQEVVDTSTGEVVTVPVPADDLDQTLEELPDLGEVTDPPAPPPHRGDVDGMHATITRLRRKIQASPNRDAEANHALRLAAATAVLKGCSGDRAVAKAVLRRLTARTNTSDLTVAECDEILALSGVDPGANEGWKTLCETINEDTLPQPTAR